MLRVVLAVVGVTVTMTWPFVNYQGLGQSLYVGDTELIVWTLAWANQALINGWPLFHSNIYFPAPNSLAYNEHLAGLSLFTLPWTLLGASPALAHNLTWACAIPLNVLAAFAWFKSAARSALAAFAGSLAFGVSFYVMLHAAGHLHLIWIWGIPLSLWLLDRWLARPRWRWLMAWTIVFVLQALTSWYLAVMIGVANLLLAAVRLMSRAGRASVRSTVTWRGVVPLFVACVVIIGCVLPFARPYIGLRGSATEAILNSATMEGFLIPPANTVAGRWWLAHIDDRPGSIWGETTVFLGWTATISAAIGLVVLARRQGPSRAWAFAIIGLAGLLLSLGPRPAGIGESWAPYAWLGAVPGFEGMRAPARFVVLLTLGIGGLATVAIDRLLQKPTLPRRALATAIVPAMLLESFVVDFPAGKPERLAVPAIYRMPEVRTARALVSLPDYSGQVDWYRGGDYLYYSTAHWRPIVNGFGRAEPPGHADLIAMTRRFPETAPTLRDLGIQYVVIHGERLPDGGSAMVAELTRHPACRLVAALDGSYLVELIRP